VQLNSGHDVFVQNRLTFADGQGAITLTSICNDPLKIGKGKGKFCIQAKWPIRPELIPVFRSMNQLGIFLLPPGWDACLSQGYPQH